MNVRMRRFLSGLVCGFLLAALLADCSEGPPGIREERDPFRARPARRARGGAVPNARMAGEPFPAWAAGRWRGEARDTSGRGLTWRVTADIRTEPGASTILYRHGGKRCSFHPRVITFNEYSLTFTESPDDMAVPCHGLGQTLVMNRSGEEGRLEGVYLDFSSGRKIVHGVIGLTRMDNQQ